VIIDISFLHPAGQDAKLPEIKKKVAALYLQQARKFRAEQQFTRANEALDKCDRFEKGSEAMVKERRLVAADEKAFKHNAQGQQKLAEIEGLKQSLRTDARANEVDDAHKTLSQLKNILPAEDAFLVREAPQLIAVAYLRLAEKKAGARDNRDELMAAVELAKSGLALDAASTGLQIALENYNRTIAKLEKTASSTSAPAFAPVLTPLAMSGPATPSSPASGKRCFGGLAGLGANARAVCYDLVSAQDKGPDMVVIPAGGGNSKPYAIGKYELSQREYDVFCKATGKESLKISEEPDIPVTGASYQDARAYAKWLTEKTGNTYRIPTDGEWVYAADAGGSRPVTDYNCFLQQGSTVLKGKGLVGVGTGGANAWGLHNFIGNVQEYVDSSSGIKVRGGSYKDSMSACGISLVKNHPGVPDQLTGFRLVREIKE
jgi:formylglycine-generating enzyme required for sulfatase activity